MKKARAKLRSQRGASITFALLLFLVCAVVSSVVVVAGSAVGGRMSQLAASDQRYYAVTSAAELLRSTFDGQAVKVTVQKDLAEDAVGKYASDKDDEDKILAHASKLLVQLREGETGSVTREFTLSASDEHDGLTCAVSETIGRNGQLMFQITSGNIQNAASAYTLRVMFSSDVRESAASATATETTTTVTWKMTGVRRGGETTP